MVVIIVLIISIITALAQIASSLSQIWKDDPLIPGNKKITTAGIWFYVFTVILVVLPAIQNAIQNDMDENKEAENKIAQDKRDKNLRKDYDSALIEMKKKFDTTNIIISETLGKYGYKLDSSNKVLVSLKDSAKTKVILSDDPVLRLSYAEEGMPGIALARIIEDGEYEFRLSIISSDAGSSYFDVSYTLIGSDSSVMYFTPNVTDNLLASTDRLGKNIIISKSVLFKPTYKLHTLFVWLKGSYKRLDGTGNFPIDEVYGFYLNKNIVRIISGETKKLVLRTIERNGK